MSVFEAHALHALREWMNSWGRFICTLFLESPKSWNLQSPGGKSTEEVTAGWYKLWQHQQIHLCSFFFLINSHQSICHSSLNLSAGVEDSHGVDGGRDPSLMGQPVWKGKGQTHMSRSRAESFLSKYGTKFNRADVKVQNGNRHLEWNKNIIKRTNAFFTFAQRWMN